MKTRGYTTSMMSHQNFNTVSSNFKVNQRIQIRVNNHFDNETPNWNAVI